MKRRQFIQTSISATATVLLLNAIGPWPAASESASRSRKRALLVGVNDYSHGNTPGVASLKGCLNDVALLKNLLITRYGFSPADIITLTNAQATRTAILDQFQTHLLTAQPDDTVVFAFSGHGSKLTDPYEKSDDAQTTGILPYDHTLQADGQTNYITGTTLFLLRSAFQTENVTIVLDCCYAGGGTRGDSTIKSIDSGTLNPRPNPRPSNAEIQYQTQLMRQLKIDPAQLKRDRNTQQGTKGVVLAASEEWQTAKDATFGLRCNAGAFTKFLTEILWETPELPLGQLQQAVTLALIRFAGDGAQTPIFTYPNNRAAQLRSRAAFFTPEPLNPTPAQGTVLTVDRDTRQLTLWLGGLSSRALNLEAGSEFRCINVRGKDNRLVIASLSDSIAPDFTAIATIPKDYPLPLLLEGSLLQQYYQPLPADLRLKLGLDPSLGESVMLPPELARIEGIPRKADRRFDGVDLILSQMTSEYHQPSPLAKPPSTPPPPIGSYGLFSSQMGSIPMSFGPSGETLADAINRLEPLLKVALVKKLFNAMTVTTQQLDETKGIDARVHLQGQPNAIVALPNQSKRSAKVGEILTIRLDNRTGKGLESLMLAIAPSGSIQIQYYPDGTINALLELLPADSGANGEILMLISPQSLAGIHSQLQELQQELTPAKPTNLSRETSRTRSRSSVDLILSTVQQTPRSRSSDDINPFVISLPIHITPTP